jgi:hypothetical protein
MKQLLALVVSLFVLVQGARAQEPPIELAPQPDADAKAIFVFGDALAGGLGAGMKRLTQEDPSINVQMRFQEESGLTRSDLYDWADAISKIAESNPIDVAVVMIGANDMRSMRAGELVHAFGTPEWTAAYNAQIDRLIASLKRTNARLYWASLPPMQNPEYNAAIATIEGLQKAKAAAAGIQYIDLRKDLINPDGSYMERGPDDTGDIRKLRDRDGVRFMKVGNNKIGKLVLTAIQSAPDEPASEPEAPVAPPVATAPGEDVPGTGPIFGQMAAADAVYVFRPASGATAAGQPLPINARDLSFQEGSSAQKLFVKGDIPAPKPGRTDDFSYTEPAPQP